jgi:diguanylate cyclase (GGDEF)-like protein
VHNLILRKLNIRGGSNRTMFQTGSQSDAGERSDARFRRIRRVHLAIVASYLYELAVLAGFHAAGYVRAELVAGLAVCIVAVNGSVFLAHSSGWSLRFADPSMFLYQQFCSILIALALAFVAPQIAIQPFGTWIGTSFFGFMAPRRGLLYVTLGASLAAMAVALAVAGSHFAMPTSTPAGQALTWAVMLGALGRGIGVANFIAGLRRRLGEQNDALRSALARIEDLAQRDELTGLPNRRAIMQWLSEQMAQCDRSGLPLTVALLDVDHFKPINDAFGHLAGDLVLEMFSKCGLAAIRATDRLGRYGGEEFLVVLVATSLPAAGEPLERIRATVAAHGWSRIDPRLRVTVTIGAAAYRRGETIKDLIGRADLALYRGKQAGRDRVVLENALRADDLSTNRRTKYWTDEGAVLS